MRSVVILIATMVGCSGEPLGMPEVQPAVKDTTAPGLLAGVGAQLTSEAETAETTQTPLEVLRSRLYSPGELDFIYRLGMIDERLKELDTRAQETQRTCVSEALQDWDITGTFPTGETFPMKINCREELSANVSYMAFGKSGDDAYLIEQQKGDGNSPTIGVFAHSNVAGTKVEFWQVMGDSESEAGEDYSYMHLVADKDLGTNELTVAAVGGGVGVGCGIQVISNTTHIYAKGIFASFGDPVQTSLTGDASTDGDSSVTEDCSGNYNAEVEICAQASDLASLDVTECSALAGTFTLKKLTYADVVATGSEATTAIVTTFVDKGTNFNETATGTE